MAWTNNPTDQREYISNIEANLAALRRKITPATLYSTTEPTEADILAAWNAQYPPAYSPDDNEVMQWVDPSTGLLQNHYSRITGLPTQRAVVEFQPAPIPFTRFGEIYIDDAGGAATQTFPTIPQTHTDLYLYILMRSSAAALTGAVNIRINGAATASYGYSIQNANPTTSPGSEGVSLTGVGLTAPGNTSLRTFYHEGLFRIFDYTSILRNSRFHYRGVYLTGATLTQTTVNNLNLFGLYNSPLAVTSLSIVGTTGWISGTRFVLFGV